MRKKRRIQLYRILFFILMCIGVGYAALTTDLSINGVANVTHSSWDIHFDNLVVNQNSTATVDQAATIDSDTAVSYEITMSQPGDFYEFTVDVVNDGTLDGMIESVSSKLNNTEITTLPSYLEYSVTYSDKVQIEPNQLLEAGNSETYKVRIGYKKDINPEDLPANDETNTFSFTVTYVQADENAVSKPLRSIIKASYGSNDQSTFRAYRSYIKNVNLDDEINPPANFIRSWDVGVNQNGDVMAYITQNADDNTMYDLYIQGDGALYANPNSSYMFYLFRELDSINNIDVLNTSRVTNMSYMFCSTGSYSSVFTLDLGNNFDTSKVTNMSNMFHETGLGSSVFTLDLGDKFDTSKVTDMSSMFNHTGTASTVFTLDLGNKFDTNQVTDMSSMFESLGMESTVFTLDLGNLFNTSNVTNMSRMFEDAGNNTSNNSNTFSLDLGDKFDTSNVTDMLGMFQRTGSRSPTFTLDLGNKFDTSNVTNMSLMFSSTGSNSTVFTLDLGDLFDTSNVTNMSNMFSSAGYRSSTFTLDLGDNFDTSNVTDMSGMFSYTGYSSTVFTLDLGDKYDTSNVTNMSHMFDYTGYLCTVFTIDFGGQFDTSQVTNMSYMFQRTGKFNLSMTLDLSSFDFTNVTIYSGMLDGLESTQIIYVKNTADQNWIITNGGNSNRTTSNVLVKT